MSPTILSRFQEYLKIIVSRWLFSLSKSKPKDKIISSESIFETVEGSHEYKIKGYSLAKGMGVGKFTSSRTFTVGGHDWLIIFYPDGNCEDNEEYASVYLKLVNTTNRGDVRALFAFKLMDQSGKGEHHETSSISDITFNTEESDSL
ncbi:hypothetical protein MKX03_017266, partial [Papaver bracteatum]